MLPKECPICGGIELIPISRPFATAESGSLSMTGVLGFHCGNGHMVLMPRAEVPGATE